MSNKLIYYNKNNTLCLLKSYVVYIYQQKIYVICILYKCTKFEARHTNYK